LKHFIPFVLLVALLKSTSARAEEPISFSGFIDLAYLWNDNRPENHDNFLPGTGTSGKRANEFMLNLAQVQWTRTTSAEQPIGFTLSLVAGDGSEIVHAAEPDGEGAFRHIYQASLAYRLPVGVLLEAGVYPSHIGAEGFYSKDNWNYTRSWIGEFSPYYQAGVKASYSFDDHWSGQLHVLNGWQIIHDNDEDKALGTQLGYANGPLTVSLNTYADADQKFSDIVVLRRIGLRWQVGASVDAGSGRGANWQGGGAYARYAFSDRHAVAVRAEQFRDPDAGISGVAQTLREATLTCELRPRERLILKLEMRYDRSTARVFADDERTQFLALAGAVVTF
jgi:hypothetical protein